MRIRHSAEKIRRRLIERSVVDEKAGCRNWLGAHHQLGYGRLWDGERLQYTHRLSHEVFIGPIPAGLDVMHDCDNPRCLEPKHLRAVASKENSQDMVRKGRHLAGVAVRAAKQRGRPSKSRGSKHKLAKLTEPKVREIRAKLKKVRPFKKGGGLMPLAREYGVSWSTIRAIRDGMSWGWLT